MALALGIAFLIGIGTAISPCVLPVLPILLAGSASGGRRRPYAIIAGLTVSFAVFTLFAAWILDALGLPRDLLRNIAIGMLFVLAATLLVPRFGAWLERPFYRFSRFGTRRELGGGFLLGASLGLVFVPCAGPVLATIVSSAASREFGIDTIALTAAYAIGVAIPMLAIAMAGQRGAERTNAFRAHAREFRAVLGAVIAVGALAIVFNVDTKLQTALNWNPLNRVENSAAARRALDDVGNVDPNGASRAAESSSLDDFGPAPNFVGISRWFNTRGGRALSLPGLRGKVVLVDFWTYTCINCLRTLPHVRGWYDRYRDAGLVVVGVHTPEFAFEGVPANVDKAVHRLGVDYPVALDPEYNTWNAYANRYWPAKYLIDRRGHVRYAHFGEGDYDRTESAIRSLLAEKSGSLPSRVREPDPTPTHTTTPESYLGSARLAGNAGMPVQENQWTPYRLPPTVPRDQLAFGGPWRVEPERAIAGNEAQLRLHFRAQDIFLVLSGQGSVRVSVNGAYVKTVKVDSNRLYALARLPQLTEGILDLEFSRGVSAYAFTFG